MSHDPIFTPDDIAQGEGTPVLGPGYFSARRFAIALAEKFTGDEMGPLIKEFSDRFYDRLREMTEDDLLSDTEANVQGHLWRTVDAVIEALIIGEGWAITRYGIGEQPNIFSRQGKIRDALFKAYRDELVNDETRALSAEAERLRRDIIDVSSRAHRHAVEMSAKATENAGQIQLAMAELEALRVAAGIPANG